MADIIDAFHWGALFQIILIDILLGGDNAVVIALACRRLAPRQRMHGILWGTVGAVLLRVVLIAFALALLEVPFLKVAGGALLLWIGIKLLAPEEEGHGNVQSAGSLLTAVKTIIVADFAMSLDNVIAIAGAAQNTHLDHQLYYVVFGLAFSVPIIVWGSTLVLKLMDRFPFIVTFGAGLLGWIAGGMLVSDVFAIERFGEPSYGTQLVVQTVAALAVVAAGKWLGSHRRTAAKALNDTTAP